MSIRNQLPFFLVGCIVVLGFLATTDPALASKEKVLYSFCTQTNCTDGGIPTSNLISGVAGNLYGVSAWGGVGQGCGNGGCGTAFELKSGIGGAWTEIVLYNFCSESNCPGWDQPGRQPSF